MARRDHDRDDAAGRYDEGVDFDVLVESHDDHDHVAVTGHLDIYTQDRLRDVLVEDGLVAPVLVLDLARVAFLDSSGLGVIVAARRRLRARQAELRLVCPPGAASRVLRVTRLDEVLPVFASLTEALAPGPAPSV